MRPVSCVVVAALAGCSFPAPQDGPLVTDGLPLVDGTADAGLDGSPGDATASDAPAPVQRRLALTISPAQGGTQQLPDFPVWVDITHPDLQAAATTDLAQFYFTDGVAPLPFQYVAWSPTSGRLRAWVRATIAASATTTLYLYYNTVEPGHPTPDAPRVFSANFRSVWHLDQTPTTTVADATGGNPGTPTGLAADDLVPGQLASGFDFDGVDDQVAITNPYDTTPTRNADHTFSAWVFMRPPVGISYNTILGFGDNMSERARFFHGSFTGGKIAMGFYGDDWVPGAGIATAQWTLLHWVYRGSTTQSDLYVNGVRQGTTSHTHGQVNTDGPDGFIGRAPLGLNANGDRNLFNGVLDEVRIASVPRDAAWIGAEYRNQSAPAAFVVPAPASEPARQAAPP